jgi:hypothetical protein
MRIDADPALPVFPGRRLTFSAFAGLLAFHAVAFGAPAELTAALQSFRAEAPRGWSYTQTTVSAGRSTVERCDATRPEFDRWSLRQKDERPPTAAEARDYFETRSRRSRGGTAPNLVEQLDLATVETLASDELRATFRCRLRPGEASDRTANFLRATLVLHRPSATLESIELHNTEPFNPTFGIHIREMRTRLTYSLPVGDVPSLPQRVETFVRGTAYWLKSLDAEMTITFHDYLPTAKRSTSP